MRNAKQLKIIFDDKPNIETIKLAFGNKYRDTVYLAHSADVNGLYFLISAKAYEEYKKNPQHYNYKIVKKIIVRYDDTYRLYSKIFASLNKIK